MFANSESALTWLANMSQRATVPLNEAAQTAALIQSALQTIQHDLTRLRQHDLQAAKEKPPQASQE